MEWNEERIAALSRLWKAGYSAAQVARELGGVSRSAVIGKVHRLGIAGRDAPSGPRGVTERTAARRAASPGGRRRATTAPAPRRTTAPCVPFEVAPTATLVSLSEHGCRWPIGEPHEDGFGFCGRLRAGRGAYCQGHMPMSLGRRLAAIPARQIDDMVSRFGDAPARRVAL